METGYVGSLMLFICCFAFAYIDGYLYLDWTEFIHHKTNSWKEKELIIMIIFEKTGLNDDEDEERVVKCCSRAIQTPSLPFFSS